jgi:hypothetical protein
MEHGTAACLYKQMKEFSGSMTEIVHACGSEGSIRMKVQTR